MPGPLLTYTIRQALSSGGKSGFLIILGHALLELLLIVLIFFGFDLILQSGAAQIAIGLIGGALLSLMGAGMLRSALKNTLTVQMEEGGDGARNMAVSGMVISAMNPYFLLWWAIIGLGVLLKAYQTFGVPGVAAFYVGHISIDFLWYGGISVIIGKTRRFIKQGLYRVIVGALGGVLVYFGVMFFVNAVKAVA
jgi:threonine/homoserine/homoserine lactone efflux protein